MAYPIGAELISANLIGVPQFEKLTICFTPHNFDFASDLQEARKQGEPYKIFEVSMIHPLQRFSASKELIEEGYYEENWEINVYPVPRELKSTAKQLLLDKALPKAKEWLEKSRTEIWKTGRKNFQVLFNEKENSIFIEQD